MNNLANNTMKPLMKSIPGLRSLAGAMLASLVAPLGMAQAPAAATATEPFDVTGQVAVGAEYNSNLSVSQVERAAGESDTAGTLAAAFALHWKPNERFTGEAGYSLDASRYMDIDSYDLDLHLLYGDASYDFGPATAGGNYYFGKAWLDGDGFLTLHQYSLYAGKLLTPQWYVRAAFNSVDKSFDSLPARDADNTGFSAEVYRFFNNGRTSVTVSYAYEDEDADGTAFRYTADTLRLRVNHKLRLWEHDARLLAGYRYHSRDYRFITPGIGVPRDDSQQVLDMKMEVTMAKHYTVIGGWQHGSYDSRLPSADYSDNRFSLALQYSF